MGCCLALLTGSNPSNSNFVELPKISLTPPTVLDPKYKGKYIQLNSNNNIAKGKGLVVGLESLNTDKVYFEVKFRCDPDSKGGSGSSKDGSGSSSKDGSSSSSSKDGSSSSKGDSSSKKKMKEVDKEEDEETSASVVAAAPATATTPPPTSSSLPPFQLGVIVKSSVTSRKTLSGSGQPDNLHEDDKTRWMWTWVQ